MGVDILFLLPYMNIPGDAIIYSAGHKPKFWILRGELLPDVMEPSIVYLAPADANQNFACSVQTF
jgi:hypothetical protein